MGIGSRLEILMKERHTNANELALKIGVAPTTIYSMIKRDSKKADIDVLLRIAQALDVDVACFGDAPAAPQDSSAPAGNEMHSPYDDMERLIARNGKKMSTDQKMRLIRLLSDFDDNQTA